MPSTSSTSRSLIGLPSTTISRLWVTGSVASRTARSRKRGSTCTSNRSSGSMKWLSPSTTPTISGSSTVPVSVLLLRDRRQPKAPPTARGQWRCRGLFDTLREADSAARESKRKLGESEYQIGCGLTRSRSRTGCDRPVTIQHRVEHDRCFYSRQWRTETIVNTATEGDVAAPVAFDIELVRFSKHRGIAVGCSEAQRNASVLKDFAPAYLGVAPHKTKQGLHRAFVTQHLFDRGLD